jgi:hypothetical protein
VLIPVEKRNFYLPAGEITELLENVIEQICNNNKQQTDEQFSLSHRRIILNLVSSVQRVVLFGLFHCFPIT